MNKPLKVIHMTVLSNDGISLLCVSIQRCLDPGEVVFDYLAYRDQEEFLEDEVRSLGGEKRVVDLPAHKNPVDRFFFKYKNTWRIFKDYQYDVVHVDASTPYDVTVAMVAKAAGVKKIILHSHTDCMHKEGLLWKIATPLFRWVEPLFVTDFIAISDSAAKFMFPGRVYRKGKFLTIKNGIQPERFCYDAEKRASFRAELQAGERYVLGHVGRLEYPKNHDFILRVFARLHREHPETMLMLVGTGTLMEPMQQLARELHVEDSVVFCGAIRDMGMVYSAMDGFIFPSRYEGLGNVAIEAQCSGLQVFAADTIVEEANISNLFYRIHGWDEDHWAREIWDNRATAPRRSRVEEVTQAGFDVQRVAQQMRQLYFQNN